MKRLLAAACVLLLCLLSVPVSAQAEATVSVTPVTVRPGDTFEVPIVVSRTERVIAVGARISYDGAVLKCVSAQMSDTVASMDMSNANTNPVGRPNEVWLTAISSQEVVLEGDIMRITFTANENASGTTTIRVLSDGLSLIVGPAQEQREVSVEGIAGNITFSADAPAQTTQTAAQTTTVAAPTTTVNNVPQTQAPTQGTIVQNTTVAQEPVTTVHNEEQTTQATQITQPTQGTTAAQPQTPGETVTTLQGQTPPPVTTAAQPQNNPTDTASPTDAQSGNNATDAPVQSQQPTVVSPAGETLVVPEETMVNVDGSVVTGVNGEPTKVQSVAVMLSKVTAKPGDTVTVEVALSAVADITAIGLGIGYDTKALTFESGECVGFVKDGMPMASVSEKEKGTVDIAAMSSKGVQGEGVIARLQFKVNDHAKSGDYRISNVYEPLIQASTVEMPVKIFAGEITVEGGSKGLLQNNQAGTLIAGGLVVIAVIAVVIVMLVTRNKKAKTTPTDEQAAQPKEEKETRPAVIDVSGDEE